MEEKKYLKWYNKIGYGSGDIAGNVVYALSLIHICTAKWAMNSLQMISHMSRVSYLRQKRDL